MDELADQIRKLQVREDELLATFSLELKVIQQEQFGMIEWWISMSQDNKQSNKINFQVGSKVTFAGRTTLKMPSNQEGIMKKVLEKDHFSVSQCWY